MLSLDEFCKVADVAIDGDEKLGSPKTANIPSKGKRAAGEVTAPASEVSSKLRSLQSAGASTVGCA